MGKRTHGQSTTPSGHVGTPEYVAWRSMISRCTIPSASHYADYGGRGISVCDHWRRSFLAFFGHVGARPSPTHSLGRIDNDGNYEPGNVRWETRAEQLRNRRSSRFLTVDGERMCIAAWAERSSVSFVAITRRLDAGWDAHSAVFAPSQNMKPRSLRRPPAYKPWLCVQCNQLVRGRKRANSQRCDDCKTSPLQPFK